MKIIALLIFIAATACCDKMGNRGSKTSKKEKTMEKFDYKKLEEMKLAKKDSYFLSDSTKVTLSESNAGLQEHKQLHNSHYNSNKTFYADTKRLKSTGEYFQRFPIGVHKEYDSTGLLIKEVNYDSFFPFSLENLALKMKNEFHIDIMNVEEGISVSRNMSTPSPYYDIAKTINEKGDLRVIRIDGTTGAIILDTVMTNKK